ncbi:hypothetical protein CLAIMM_01042 isoform 2, partial [Cladophialophora immunda]
KSQAPDLATDTWSDHEIQLGAQHVPSSTQFMGFWVQRTGSTSWAYRSLASWPTAPPGGFRDTVTRVLTLPMSAQNALNTSRWLPLHRGGNGLDGLSCPSLQGSHPAQTSHIFAPKLKCFGRVEACPSI